MGLLDSFERGLERAVNGAFARTFRSGLQPVEIASALRAELDSKAAVVSRDRILVPNRFQVRLSPSDFERMTALGSSLAGELDSLVQAHARTQGYSFAGRLAISLVADGKVPTGTVRVSSTSSASSPETVTWRAVVEIDGKQHPLHGARTVIGRGSDADITINDTGTSRKHVEILWDGERGMVRDLGSTNGTTLNGRKVTQAPLEPDSTILIGRTRIVFRVVASASAPRTARSGPDTDATRAFSLGDVERWGDDLR